MYGLTFLLMTRRFTVTWWNNNWDQTTFNPPGGCVELCSICFLWSPSTCGSSWELWPECGRTLIIINPDRVFFFSFLFSPFLMTAERSVQDCYLEQTAAMLQESWTNSSVCSSHGEKEARWEPRGLHGHAWRDLGFIWPSWKRRHLESKHQQWTLNRRTNLSRQEKKNRQDMQPILCQ